MEAIVDVAKMTPLLKFRARLLWRAGADTNRISRLLDIHEHELWNDRSWRENVALPGRKA